MSSENKKSAFLQSLEQIITKPETADLAKEAFAFVAFKKIINLKD